MVRRTDLILAGAMASAAMLGLVAAATRLPGGLRSHPPHTSLSPRPSAIALHSGTGESDREAVRWAVDRFEEAELPLPPIRVGFHDDKQPCGGAQGTFDTEHGVGEIRICLPEREGSMRELKAKRTLLHEFAHAWDHFSLSEQVRTAFRRYRGTDAWLSELPYHERAGEHAAEVITWGLIDEPLLMGTLAEPWPWEELHHGYLLLTGSQPPHGYVWDWFAVNPLHRVYARNPSQLEAVRRAWETGEGDAGGERGRILVRFHRQPDPCDGAPILSRRLPKRIEVDVCGMEAEEVTAALREELDAFRPSLSPVPDSVRRRRTGEAVWAGSLRDVGTGKEPGR